MSKKAGTSKGALESSREGSGYFVVGLGAGALIDGFVLHQLLQWHHLWSSRTPDGTLGGLEENTLADGIFHSASLVVLLVGLALLVGVRVQGRPFLGLALCGWGAFNIVDQLVFHLVLGAHHIREDVESYAVYDWAFFGLGVALLAAGLAITRGAR